MQSVVGVLVWFAAAGICVFASEVVRRRGGDARMRAFLLASAVISAVLALDDQFMVHEELSEGFTGIHEDILLLAYGALVVAWAVWFRDIIGRSEWGLLGLAFGSFVVSLLIDQFHGDWDPPYRISWRTASSCWGSWCGARTSSGSACARSADRPPTP